MKCPGDFKAGLLHVNTSKSPVGTARRPDPGVPAVSCPEAQSRIWLMNGGQQALLVSQIPEYFEELVVSVCFFSPF